MVFSLYDFEAVDGNHKLQISSQADGNRRRGSSTF